MKFKSKSRYEFRSNFSKHFVIWVLLSTVLVCLVGQVSVKSGLFSGCEATFVDPVKPGDELTSEYADGVDYDISRQTHQSIYKWAFALSQLKKHSV